MQQVAAKYGGNVLPCEKRMLSFAEDLIGNLHVKSVKPDLNPEVAARQDATCILLTGVVLGALLQDLMVAGTAMVLSLVAAASALHRRPMLQTAPAKAQTDLKTLGDTR